MSLPYGCTLVPPPHQRRRHLGTKVRPDGAVSALCFKSPRSIDMKRATWKINRSAGGCPICRRMMRWEEIGKYLEMRNRPIGLRPALAAQRNFLPYPERAAAPAGPESEAAA